MKQPMTPEQVKKYYIKFSLVAVVIVVIAVITIVKSCQSGNIPV